MSKSIFKNDVVQFMEGHEWHGCLGIVEEDKGCEHPRRYLIGVPVPQEGIAYIFNSGENIERIGKAVLAFTDGEK